MTACTGATVTVGGSNICTGTITVANPFIFQGQYRDNKSGLYYLRARYYDPATGQFLTVDPDVAFTWSPYGYAAGNPVNRLDPSGVDPWDPNGRYAATPQLQPHPWNDVPPLCAGTSQLRCRVPRFSSRHFRSPTLAVGTPPREDRSSEGERSSRVLAVDSPLREEQSSLPRGDRWP